VTLAARASVWASHPRERPPELAVCITTGAEVSPRMARARRVCSEPPLPCAKQTRQRGTTFQVGSPSASMSAFGSSPAPVLVKLREGWKVDS
jgi:hypothetical protein